MTLKITDNHYGRLS